MKKKPSLHTLNFSILCRFMHNLSLQLNFALGKILVIKNWVMVGYKTVSVRNIFNKFSTSRSILKRSATSARQELSKLLHIHWVYVVEHTLIFQTKRDNYGYNTQSL